MKREDHCVYQKGQEVRNDLKKNTGTFGAFIIIEVVVLLIGTFLFFYIEQCAYPTQVSLSEVEKAYQDICSIALNSTGNSNGEDWTERLQTRVAEICNQTASATTPTKPSCDLDRRSFATWFGYSITVAFTIGYGHTVTRSLLGKIMTMLYAIPAIGVTVTMYSYAGKFINNITKIVLLLLEINLLKHERISHCAIKAFVGQILFSLFSLFILGMLVHHGNYKELSLIDSVYYGFITLTTIGFGDVYIPPEQLLESPVVFVTRLFIFFFGMGAVASVITSFGDLMAVQKNEVCPKKAAKDHEKLDHTQLSELT